MQASGTQPACAALPLWVVLGQRFELARGEAGQNLRPMEGLRGLAVFMVFLVHYVTLSLPWVPPDSATYAVADLLHAMGNIGVDLFFVLSGYLIYGSLIVRPQAFRPYFWRRLVRIYPAFLVVFALYLVLSVLFPAERKIPSEPGDAALFLLANLLLLPGVFPITPLITVAWSLSYELVYYLTMPLLVLALSLRQRSPGWRVACFAGLAALGLVVFGLLGGPVRLLMFVPGVLLWEWLHRQPVAHGRSLWGLLTLLAALALATLPAPGSWAQALKVAVLGGLFMPLCWAAFSDRNGWLSRALCWTPMRWLGNMSYSYYLIHGLTLKALFMLVGRLWPASGPGAELTSAGLFWWLLPLAFTLTCLPATVLFLAVERPLSLGRARGVPSARIGARLNP